MKKKELARLWVGYMKTMNKHQILPEDDPDRTSVVYGSDEFKIDYERKQIRINKTWLPVPTLDVSEPRPDWVAILLKSNDVNDAAVVLGHGSPYSPDSHYIDNPLFSNGIITAFPNGLM